MSTERLNTMLLLAVIAMLVWLGTRPQPGRYVPIDADHMTFQLDSATGKVFAVRTGEVRQ